MSTARQHPPAEIIEPIPGSRFPKFMDVFCAEAEKGLGTIENLDPLAKTQITHLFCSTLDEAGYQSFRVMVGQELGVR